MSHFVILEGEEATTDQDIQMGSLIRENDHTSNMINVLVKELCIITLEDVTLQLGLPIDDSAVTGTSKVSKPAALCYHLLGRSPDDGEDRFTSLKFSWLKGNFETLPSSATKWEKMCTTRAYILHLIFDRGVLKPDANNNMST
ncbi:serine/threonine-protein phosphatase 7 long form-like protein [Gossypium australe]|uniref:Serine/threonine-protein phosphatase 7 long form-like protein n=1 Tax=Gossypium australe TaxID=47621 RepID=A0A5B6UTC8_9ROSI|nr:serine/threonine-protein phosphatase 7 long form-like protein [Gossypium australe]